MPRVKRGNVRRAKRKKLLARAKGFYQTKSKLYRSAKESVDTALKYAFVGRRRKKRDFRRLWVMRINAAARENGLTYGQLIAGLKLAGNTIDRKSLADLASPARRRSRRLAKPSRRRQARRSSPPRRSNAARQSTRPRPRIIRLDVRAVVGAATRPFTTARHLMSDPARQVDDLRAQFERDLAAAVREADLRAVRDRYLVPQGRAGLGAAEGPRLRAGGGAAARSASSPTSSSSTSRPVWPRGSRTCRRESARPPRRRRRDAARPAAARRASPSADDPARARRGDLHAVRLPGDRRARARRRLPQLRSAQHAAGASRARHAGHAVSRGAGALVGRVAGDAAADAHLRHADPLHGDITRRRSA